MAPARPLSKWFEYDAQADNYRSKLITAACGIVASL
jgi:hypothetical protein